MIEPEAKLHLLKWVDACSTAIDCIGQADPDKILLLAEELEICVIKPLEGIFEALRTTYNSQANKSFPKISFNKKNVIDRKKDIIHQINRLIVKINEETGSSYRKIEYDPSYR